MYREFFNFVDLITALRFTETSTLLSARCIRILPTNQHAGWPITFGVNFRTAFVATHEYHTSRTHLSKIVDVRDIFITKRFPNLTYNVYGSLVCSVLCKTVYEHEFMPMHLNT
jgi:hypothetical protein